ncbi:MAG: hypothetical protein E7774_08840 [Bradyrhizobium sp.]|nr:MAG: hypothetical protein E7774_08840 [Bradyrhizobium sp.]
MIQANKKEATRLANDMRHVEAVIRMFAPDYNVRAISAKRRNVGNPWFKRGTLFRNALDILREAGEPLTARVMADRLLAAKGATSTQRAKIQAGILASLRDNEGKIVEPVGEGKPVRWVLRP